MKRDMQHNRRHQIWFEPSLWIGAFILSLSWLSLMMMFHFDPFGHGSHDSYTLQALAWRAGKISLGKDYPWLELAIYKNDWYVSFPPVPTIVMLPLTYIFGEETPGNLITGLYFLGSYFAAYFLSRRVRNPSESCFLAVFMTMGCSLFDFSLNGDVWNQAQLLCFFLTTLFVLGITGNNPKGWGTGLACLALSVGCRPFQVVFVPFGLIRLCQNLKKASRKNLLIRMMPYIAFPLLVAITMAWYNNARFGNPLEFGHNYLPEFTRDPSKPQLSLQYVIPNLKNLIRLPYMNNGRLEFVRFNGFAFWMVNPIYISMPIALMVRAYRKELDCTDALLIIMITLELFALLTHKTLGGWQFGARYLCDPIPLMFFVQIRRRDRLSNWEKAIAAFAIIFNLYGSIVFRMMNIKF